ncbi:MAG: hypothetical protein JW759_09695 [Candidatus Coatesbacteria bacterium]|nr:hypothetical protein [Candidatus Coatesbacteria bacterium]
MTKQEALTESPVRAKERDYSEFIAGLNLTSICLGSASIKFSPEIYAAKRLPPVSFSHTAQLGEVSAKGFKALEEFVIKGKETARSPVLMSIRCGFVARYDAQVQITPEIFALFKESTLILNVWPYIREFVQSCVVRAGLPPLTLPSQIFLPKPKSK